MAKIPNGVELLTFSQEKLHPRCLTKLKIGFWLRVLHIELTFVPNLQTKPKNTQPEKMCDIIFEKGKGRGRKVNRACVYAESAVRRVLKKKVLREISQNSQENICNGISFWCFLVNFAKFVKTPFLQNSSERLLLIIAVSIVAKEVLVNQTENYETITKGHVLI